MIDLAKLPADRLLTAHGMSLELQHHTRVAHISREMLSVKRMAEVLAPWFEVDTALADREDIFCQGNGIRGTRIFNSASISFALIMDPRSVLCWTDRGYIFGQN